MCARRRIGRLDGLLKSALTIQIVVLGAGMWAQQRPTILSRVNVVTLFATVHDADGRVVKNLTPDDFVLLEDGERQNIEFFSKETDLPLTIGLFVDTSRSQTGVLKRSVALAMHFSIKFCARARIRHLLSTSIHKSRPCRARHLLAANSSQRSAS